MRTRRRTSVVGLLVGAGFLWLGAVRAAADPPAPWVNSHVRAVGLEATRLLEAARTRSAIVAGLVTRLEASDVVVFVTPVTLTQMRTGDLTWMGFSQGIRYLRLRVCTTQPSLDATIEWLAHELRHAIEVAEAEEVSSGKGFDALFRRIGMEWKTGSVETTAAIDIQHAVKQELREHRPRRRPRPDTPPPGEPTP